jgi:hypothetical protein
MESILLLTKRAPQSVRFEWRWSLFKTSDYRIAYALLAISSLLALSTLTVARVTFPLNIVRKGQVKWLAKSDIAGQVAFIVGLFALTGAA